MSEELYCVEGVQIKENKILTPRQLCEEVLQSLHSVHQCVHGMLTNTTQRLFWHGLDASIRQARAQCQIYYSYAPSQPKKSLILLPSPEFPFRQTVIDFFDIHSRNYVIYADKYTGWVEVVLMLSGNSGAVCDTQRPSEHMVYLKNFLPTGDHLFIPKNTNRYLRTGEYGNLLRRLPTHTSMAG